MNRTNQKYYPTILKAVHLVVLYMFIQSIIDFPLALYDYYNGTDYLYNPLKKVVLGIGSLAFIFIYAYKKAKAPVKELFPLKSFNIFLLIPIFLFIWGAQNLISVVNVGIDMVLPPPPWFWELFNKVFESDFGIYGAFLKVVIIAPIVEELIFRGIIMYGLMRNYSASTAIFTSALMFALFHLNPWQFPATFVLGALLGFLMVRKRNILLCILGHAINNGIALFGGLIGNEISFLHSQTSLLMISFLVVMVSFVIIYIVTKSNTAETDNQ
jgi:membrane protease YdiL (CAAX protease family)